MQPKSMVRAFALAASICIPSVADAAHCRFGRILIRHLDRCVSDESRLAERYFWNRPRWRFTWTPSRRHTPSHYAALHPFQVQPRMGRHAPILERPLQQEEEKDGTRVGQQNVGPTPPPGPDAAEVLLPFRIEQSRLDRRPQIYWRLP